MLMLPLLVAACSTAKVWENPNVPREQWSLDRAACQDQARMQAEREFTLDQQANRSLPQNQAAPWTTQMDRFSAQQSQTQLFGACMNSRGYTLVPASEASEPAEAPGQSPAAAPGASPK